MIKLYRSVLIFVGFIKYIVLMVVSAPMDIVELMENVLDVPICKYTTLTLVHVFARMVMTLCLGHVFQIVAQTL